MRAFEVKPLNGVAPITLGMSREASRQAMSQPFHTIQKVEGGSWVDAYFENSFQIFFCRQNTVEFIELSSHAEASVILMGLDVFSTDAKSLLAALAQASSLISDDNGYSYVDPALSLGLWRPVLPDVDDDTGRLFSTVGIGIHGYYASVPNNRVWTPLSRAR
jgi:hypothetical protein